jgi:hypothetical protein
MLQSSNLKNQEKKLNPEALTCKRLTAGVVFPPYPLQPVDVNRLYAIITERYPYQSLQHLPDGARMSNPDGDCFIQTTRIQVNENVMHFQSAKEKTMDLMEIIQDGLSIPQFMTFGVKLTSFLPLNSAPAASEFIESKMVPEVARNASILGEGRQGTGIRMVVHRDGGIHELKVEPFFNDLSQLYVELDVQYPAPFNDITLVEQRIGDAYDYLFGPVKEFIASFAR